MRKRALQVVVVCLLAFTMLGAGTPATSFDKVGHQLICQCGCGQILLECNHVGCPVSGPMIEELKTQFASGLSSSAVLNWFVNKYGPIVLAAPIRGGFDDAAWIVPIAVFALGLLAVFVLARLWRQRNARVMAGVDAPPAMMMEEVRERIRRESNVP